MHSVADPRRNVELKAVDADPARSLAACRALGARDEGVLRQRDTYYVVPHGRLKLREEEPGAAHLIQYERAARPEQRESRYRIVEVADAATAHAMLEAALGVECVVAKRRRLFLWHNVRIHLDEVEQLGCFVELEAVATSDSDLSAEYDHVATLRDALAIDDARLVPHGYAQLLRGADASA
jgi:predicted adenylyl cyclase CyaB